MTVHRGLEAGRFSLPGPSSPFLWGLPCFPQSQVIRLLGSYCPVHRLILCHVALPLVFLQGESF